MIILPRTYATVPKLPTLGRQNTNIFQIYTKISFHPIINVKNTTFARL